MQTNAENVIESIRQLPVAEQEKVLHWLEEKRRPRKSNTNGQNEKFQAALRWIDQHRADHLGQWVCLDGDKLVASGGDAKNVYRQAKAKGIEIPFIEKVREEDESPYWGGWD